MEETVDEPQTIEKALTNCFDFLAPHLPTLENLSSSGNAITMVLQAACLATFRRDGSLEQVTRNVLEIVKADGLAGSGYREGEVEKLDLELDRLLFSSDADAITFARRYIEPQFSFPNDSAVRLYILDRGEVFNRVKGALSLDWLKNHPNMPAYAMDKRFKSWSSG